MTFIAVVLGFMVFSILLIHWLTAHFGYRLDYRSLALCAVMAVAVTFGAILTSKVLTWHYYLKLGLLTLVASGLVTAYDVRLDRRRQPLAVAGGDNGLVEETDAAVLEKASSKMDDSDETTEVKVSMPEPVEPRGQEVNTPSAEKVSVESVKPAMSVFEMHSQEAPVEVSEPETKPESVAGDSTGADDALMRFGSLDDILDYAYEQRAKGNIEEAIRANQMALMRYAEDDYAPYIAIELGNIYKERAEYKSAIGVYEKALNIPSVIGNEGICKEFVKSLFYLRSVLQVLSKHNAQDTPFGKISREYMKEIEADFQLRHN